MSDTPTARPELSPLITMEGDDPHLVLAVCDSPLHRACAEIDAQRAALAAAQAENAQERAEASNWRCLVTELCDLSPNLAEQIEVRGVRVADAVLHEQQRLRDRATAAEAALERTQAEREALREARGLSDAQAWEIERLLERLRRDDAGNFPPIQALEAALTAPASAAPATREGA